MQLGSTTAARATFQQGWKWSECIKPMVGTDNAITVAPGETEELTWQFTNVGSLEFGCHEPGHFEGGMVGTIEVG